MCAHTVAVALKVGNIDGFVEWFLTMKRPATEFNVTALAAAEKPASAGKKTHRRGISKKGSAQLQSMCSNVPESSWSYRGQSSSVPCSPHVSQDCTEEPCSGPKQLTRSSTGYNNQLPRNRLQGGRDAEQCMHHLALDPRGRPLNSECSHTRHTGPVPDAAL